MIVITQTNRISIIHSSIHYSTKYNYGNTVGSCGLGAKAAGTAANADGNRIAALQHGIPSAWSWVKVHFNISASSG